MFSLATTYFVRTDGSDSNSGLVNNAAGAFLTVQKGANTAVGGDTVLVGAGTYSEDVLTTHGGTSKITIDGQSAAILRRFSAIHSNINFVNWTVRGATSGSWFNVGKGAHFTTISNCIFDGGLDSGSDRIIRWESPSSDELPWGTNCASGVLVISNTLQNILATTAISVFGDTNTIIGNRFLDSDAVDWLQLWGRSNRVVGNIFSNSYESGVGGNHPDFVQSFGLNGHGGKDMLIESNLVIASHGSSQLCMFEGQDCIDLHDFVFQNNLFIGISSKGTMGIRNVSWLNNTFINCSTNPTTAGPVLIFGAITNDTYTNFFSNTGNGARVLNNVFWNYGDGTTNRVPYSFETYMTNVSADYNFVSVNSSNVVFDPTHRAIGAVGGWNKAAWWEDHGINGGNPLFVNESTLNFRLQVGSPLINTGTNLPSVAVDLDGVSRPQGAAWDIGAFEGGIAVAPASPKIRGIRLKR